MTTRKELNGWVSYTAWASCILAVVTTLSANGLWWPTLVFMPLFAAAITTIVYLSDQKEEIGNEMGGHRRKKRGLRKAA